MNFSQITLIPLLPWADLAFVSAAGGVFVIVAVNRRAPGGLLRGLGLLFLVAILAGPHWDARTTKPLPDIAIVLVDHSQSMAIGHRDAMAAKALAGLAATAGSTQIRVVDVPAADDGGTGLFAALHDARAAVPAAQLAGIVAITDGEVADAPLSLPDGPPFTALLAATAPQTDRELRLLNVPAYGLVGQHVTLRFVVIDHGVSDAGAPAVVKITVDGTLVAAQRVVIGQVAAVSLPVTHAGAAVIVASAEPLAGEVSQINDQAAFTLNGIHKRLTVLLISGSPDQGERSWRLLLKSDPAVQLLHFTLLRIPGEPIDAEQKDLALVPFPVRQLFETDIGKFDLIIMDRFDTTGLLPPEYISNIASYVQQGGALLVELGPEFAATGSLALTPLSALLPAAPNSYGTLTEQFVPAVTALGQRHPVTASLANAVLPPWYRMEATTPLHGDVLMTGADHVPLLILAAAGKGRVGMLLSDQFWLWTRGGAHDGPALPLLRRIVHWLLREPALEAESLSAGFAGGALVVTRQTMAAGASGDAVVTAPDGKISSLALRQMAPGEYAGRLAVTAQTAGIWKITQAGLTTFTASSAMNAAEYQDLAATDKILTPLSLNVVWLGQNPRPALGGLLLPRHASQVTGTRDVLLLPPLPAMLAVLALLFAAWWRESY